MLLLLRQNSFGPRSLGRKIKSKAMWRVLGFGTDWFRGNVCVILQYSVAFSMYQSLSHQALCTAAISEAVACLLLKPVYTINVGIDQTE